MPRKHKSVVRQHRRSLRAAERNQANVSRLRTALRKIRASIASKDAAASSEALRPTISLIDHAVSLKAVHRNAASRLKSRLTRQVAGLRTGSAS